MKLLLMMRGARKLVESSANVRAGERVVIVTDFARASVGKAMAAAAHSCGAQVSLIAIPPLTFDSEEPPGTVAAAMREADVVFTPMAKSIAHSAAVHRALLAGARVMSMTDFVDESLMTGGIEADFARLKPLCDHVARLLSQARLIRVSSPAGTDIQFDVDGREGNSHPCVISKPGEFSGAINIEANIAPIEGTAEGTIVADAAIPNYGVGVLKEPVRYEVQRGMITEIRGGEQANRIKSVMTSANDINVFNVAQLGLGLNPNCRTMERLQEAHGYWGTCHFGIGTSENLGGTVRAAMHYDCHLWNPKVELDGNVIIDSGDVLVGKEFVTS